MESFDRENIDKLMESRQIHQYFPPSEFCAIKYQLVSRELAPLPTFYFLSRLVPEGNFLVYGRNQKTGPKCNFTTKQYSAKMHTTHIVHKSKSATTQNYRLYFTKLLYVKNIKIRTDKSMCTHNIHIAI